MPHEIIPELLVCCRCWSEIVHIVLMLIVDWLHSTLPQLGLFIDTFTFFPCSLIWLGCPRSGCEIQSPKSVCIHIATIICISQEGNSNDTYRHPWLWSCGRESSAVHPDSLLAGNRDSESTEAIPRGHLGTFGMHCCRVWLPTEWACYFLIKALIHSPYTKASPYFFQEFCQFCQVPILVRAPSQYQKLISWPQ